MEGFVMALRKSVATLTAGERAAFVNAVKQLKLTPSRFTPPTTSRYDDYVYVHMQAMLVIKLNDPTKPVDNSNWTEISSMPMWAHRCPAFLPWHRELLRNFEKDLQAVSLDSTLGIPYWDWSVDQNPNSVPWTDDFMGGDGHDGPVTRGPFAGSANWKLNLSEDNDNGGPGLDHLTRGFGLCPGFTRLPTAAEVQTTLAVPVYDQTTWDDRETSATFRNELEGWYVPPGSTVRDGMHNLVHLWVGGNTGAMLPSSSPNDPIFFLHHCNIDRLWSVWQSLQPGPHYAPPVPLPAEPGQGLDEPMIFHDPAVSTTPPWSDPPATPVQMVDHRALGYAYDTDGPVHAINTNFLAFGKEGLAVNKVMSSQLKITPKDRFKLRLSELSEK
jgi:tyrosinase